MTGMGHHAEFEENNPENSNFTTHLFRIFAIHLYFFSIIKKKSEGKRKGRSQISHDKANNGKRSTNFSKERPSTFSAAFTATTYFFQFQYFLWVGGPGNISVRFCSQADPDSSMEESFGRSYDLVACSTDFLMTSWQPGLCSTFSAGYYYRDTFILHSKHIQRSPEYVFDVLINHSAKFALLYC